MGYDPVVLARQIRLSVVVDQLRIGNITEKEAEILLDGPLTPGDDSTLYNDAHLLYDERGLEKIAGLMDD